MNITRITAILCLITVNTYAQIGDLQKIEIVNCDNWRDVIITEDTSISKLYVITSDLGIDIKERNRSIKGLADLTAGEVAKLKKQGCKYEAALIQIVDIELVSGKYHLSCAGYSKFREI